jgi:hypothetical protein
MRYILITKVYHVVSHMGDWGFRWVFKVTLAGLLPEKGPNIRIEQVCTWIGG